jgi:Xylose isomerase-like TIM barrel
MRRREFLIGSTIAAGSARKIWGQTPDKEKLSRIGIMTACFSSIIKNAAHPDDPKKTLELLDLPDMYAEHYGVRYMEPTCLQFTSTETPYLKEFAGRLKKAKIELNQISLGQLSPGIPGSSATLLNISSSDPVLRLEAIDLTKRWIDHAAFLGCPRVMVNQGTLMPEIRTETVAALKAMTDYGKTKNVKVTMETRGGGGGAARGQGRAAAGSGSAEAALAGPASYAGDWRVLVEVLKGAGAWTNVDIGNFPSEEERHAALRAMLPMSSGSSHAHYAPERWNFHDTIQISKELGYKGIWSVESGGNNGPDAYSQVQTIVDALVKEI